MRNSNRRNQESLYNSLLNGMKYWFLMPDEPSKEHIESHKVFMDKFYDMYRPWNDATKNDFNYIEKFLNGHKPVTPGRIDQVMFAFYGSGRVDLIRKCIERGGHRARSTIQNILADLVPKYRKKYGEFLRRYKIEPAHTKFIMSVFRELDAILGKDGKKDVVEAPVEIPAITPSSKSAIVEIEEVDLS